ncbi:MAG: hypothetical protein AAF368_14210, partial [Planctomycetota bacterium]
PHFRGIVWVDDSLYLLTGNELLNLTDSDDDGIADDVDTLVSGFDPDGTGLSMKGPMLHPNGRLFWSHASLPYRIPDPDTGEPLFEGRASHLWFSKISGSDLTPFQTGKFESVFDIGITERGEIPNAGFASRASIFETANVRSLCRYHGVASSTGFGGEWLLIGDDASQLLAGDITRAGAGFTKGGFESVLALNSPNERFTDVIEDHTGDILVLVSGKSNRVLRVLQGDEPFAAPDYPAWDTLSSAEVADLLVDDRHWVREKAITELAVRGAPALPELRRLLASPEVSARTHRLAVWTLARMQFSESIDLIHAALDHDDAGVRQVACNAIGVTRRWQSIAANQPAERRIEMERNRTISGSLARIVRYDEAPVSREAAVALGRMAENRAVGSILGRLGRTEDDPILAHALVSALVEIDDPEIRPTARL